MSRPSLGYSNYYWIRQDQKKAEKARSELELQHDAASSPSSPAAAAINTEIKNQNTTLAEKPQDSWKLQRDSLAANPQNRLESSELAATQHNFPETLAESLPDTQESLTSLPVSLDSPVITAAVPQSFPLVNQITSWKPQTDSEK